MQTCAILSKRVLIRVKSSAISFRVTKLELLLLDLAHLVGPIVPLTVRYSPSSSARFLLKKLLTQVHATQNIYLHNIVGICTKRGP